jgi:hypothetical protein
MKTNQSDISKITATLNGVTPIMFDRYAGDNKTQLEVEKKMYFMPDGKTICLPAMNIMSFLSAKNTTSISKIIGGKSWNKICDAMLSYVVIQPSQIPILREGNEIQFNGFTDDYDEEAKIRVHYAVARLAKGIPNPKIRPVVSLPWELTFQITLFKNDVIDEEFLKSAFVKGGYSLGLGTFRGVYGKYFVSDWNK